MLKVSLWESDHSVWLLLFFIATLFEHFSPFFPLPFLTHFQKMYKDTKLMRTQRMGGGYQFLFSGGILHYPDHSNWCNLTTQVPTLRQPFLSQMWSLFFLWEKLTFSRIIVSHLLPHFSYLNGCSSNNKRQKLLIIMIEWNQSIQLIFSDDWLTENHFS